MVDVADLTPIVQAEGLGKLLGKSQLFVQWRKGNNPASLEIWPDEGSTTMGFEPPRSNES